MSRSLRLSFAAFIWLFALPLAAWGDAPPDEQARRLEFFEKKVRPVLVENCFNCHSANTNSRGGLRVDDRNGLVIGGDHGPAIIPGAPEKSLLVQAIRHTHAKLKMPPKQHLSEEQIADIERWIRDGLAWPPVQVPKSTSARTAEYAELRKTHWAWQPLKAAPAPEVKNDAWPRDELDRRLLAAIEAKGLAPVADAEPLDLVRRITFDLTGLPPSPEEIDSFLAACESPGSKARQSAIEQLVDRLLASPAYGERWGRHWLDVARYGESTGSARNVAYPHAWRYRDYVIDAFNRDKPYDQFVREQIAGDLLPAADQAQSDEQRIATGFLALGVCDVNQRFKIRFTMDNIDEQIDTVSRGVLGLTVSCARCHDHKFDPIPTADYYALAGIFNSSLRCAGVRNKMGGGGMDYYDTAMIVRLRDEKADEPAVAEKIEQAKASLAQAKSSLSALQENSEQPTAGEDREKDLVAARKRVREMQDTLLALNDPASHGPVALGVREAPTVGDTEIRIRGEAEQLGPSVPRGYLSVVSVPGSPQITADHSGRLELAQWLTSPDNPLTPRVMANRVWRQLFGEGLVKTVDNFGTMGDAPSHPELLDHLALRLVRDGWSVKKLIRAIVLSRAYQLSADAPAANMAIDPANRLIWRHSPRRLAAEEIRDAMLAASGELILQRPAGSAVQDFKVMELRNNGPEAERLAVQCLASKHRSLYLPLLRGLVPRSLEVFDFAEQGMTTGSRDTTTVPTQALYLLNDPLVRTQAEKLAGRVLKAEDDSDADRIRAAFRLTLGRAATEVECERAVVYLADYKAAAQADGLKKNTDGQQAAWSSFCQALFASAEFRYVR